MRIRLNKDIKLSQVGDYITPDCKPDGLYIGSTKLNRSDYDHVPDLVPFEEAIYLECDVDCDEGLFDLSVSLRENHQGREYHNDMNIQFIEYEPTMIKIKELEDVIRRQAQTMAEWMKKCELLEENLADAKDALRPLCNIPIQDFDYFEKPTHILNSWVGKNSTHGLTVQHVINARKVFC